MDVLSGDSNKGQAILVWDWGDSLGGRHLLGWESSEGTITCLLSSASRGVKVTCLLSSASRGVKEKCHLQHKASPDG